jgi:hypothetical protein
MAVFYDHILYIYDPIVIQHGHGKPEKVDDFLSNTTIFLGYFE